LHKAGPVIAIQPPVITTVRCVVIIGLAVEGAILKEMVHVSHTELKKLVVLSVKAIQTIYLAVLLIQLKQLVKRNPQTKVVVI
jgi:hypothetical protein